jgi:hypothetical protein
MVMKYKLVVAACACALTFLSAGCYTQLATREPAENESVDNEDTYASEPDTTSGAVVNNYYFGDDVYRHSRFQMAFGYYSPYTWGGYAGIYDPWFDDPWYWTYGWRPNVLYPYPTWYPYGGYYGHHYWGYYNTGGYYSGGGYAHGSAYPSRTRTMSGSSRGMEGYGIRSRAPGSYPTNAIASPGTAGPQTGIRTRGTSSDERNTVPTQATTSTRTRGNDVPWWERVKQDEQRSQQSQPAASTQTQAQQGRRTRQAASQASSTRQAAASQGTQSAAPARRQRSSGGGQANGGRQQHAAPAQTQSHASPPPANNGGGGRSGGGSQSGGGSHSSGGSGKGRER